MTDLERSASTEFAMDGERSMTARLLASVSQIAASLASSDSPTGALTNVLERVVDTLGVQGASLWVLSDESLKCEARTGLKVPSPLAARELLASDRTPTAGDPVIIRLTAGSTRLGALIVATASPLTPEQRLYLATLADIVAPSIMQAANALRLEAELLARTRQMDRERKLTDQIIDSLPVGLYVIDREYRISVWNRKRETGMQGVSREEAIGRTIFEILHRQPEPVLRREFDEVFATGKLQIFQMESTVTGELRTYRISKIPMRLDNGPVTHVITIGEDVTEWRQAQDRFAQTEKLAAIGTLAAGVMHEINNPLATISACAESLEMIYEDLPAEVKDGFKLIEGEVQRCKRIVDSLLDFSRPRAEDKALVNVNDVIGRTLFVLKHHARFKKLTVRSELDESLHANVRANFEQLMQVFISLLINAMDAMHDRGTVTLRTRLNDDGNWLIAEVLDEGEGIRRSDLTKIFEPFFTTKPPGRGTGLGLSICYAIVAEHGGRIEVDSTPGEGSVFRIVLPRADLSGSRT
jgi:two-component system NtrC family sensor kinase